MNLRPLIEMKMLYHWAMAPPLLVWCRAGSRVGESVDRECSVFPFCPPPGPLHASFSTHPPVCIPFSLWILPLFTSPLTACPHSCLHHVYGRQHCLLCSSGNIDSGLLASKCAGKARSPWILAVVPPQLMLMLASVRYQLFLFNTLK